MKKELYLCGAMLVAMASCSNEGTIPGESENSDLTPVVLGLQRASADVEAGRGTGTVGGTTEATNRWNYEDLYVLMTTSDAVALEGPENAKPEWGFTSVDGVILKEQFNNTFFARPVEEERDGGKVWNIDYSIDPNAGGGLRYYPVQGVSDFFAYYVDDAAKTTDANGNPEIEMVDNAISVAYEINGSQDLLQGKADVAPTGTENGFSAKTARAGIIPSIKMKHMLTRLTFTLKNGNANAANVTVTRIGVISRLAGKMYVAYKNEPAKLMEWESTTDTLDLMQAKAGAVSSLQTGKSKLEALAPIKLDGQNDVDAGEALFVAPLEDLEGVKTYSLVIEVEQTVTVGPGTTNIEKKTMELDLKLSNGTFEAGKSYHVNATVYGFEQIILEADLEPWVEHDEDLNVGGDNDVNGAIF